jgi:predicted GNAT superfamily acetyltransferase
MENDLKIRECVTLDELTECVQLQRDVFALPETELSPVRHLIVTKNAGGFVLGAFDGERLAGFVLSVPAFLREQRAFYSHMTGVRSEYQSHGVGARLKWAQRTRALAEGVKYIKWTFEPVKARNAYFNLEKLGATVSEFQENFYGTDYGTAPEVAGQKFGLASDRLFAEWHLESPKVQALAAGEQFVEMREPTATVQIMNDWLDLVASDPQKSKAEQLRIREEFKTAFGFGMVCRGFYRDDAQPAFLLYKD